MIIKVSILAKKKIESAKVASLSSKKLCNSSKKKLSSSKKFHNLVLLDSSIDTMDSYLESKKNFQSNKVSPDYSELLQVSNTTTTNRVSKHDISHDVLQNVNKASKMNSYYSSFANITSFFKTRNNSSRNDSNAENSSNIY